MSAFAAPSASETVAITEFINDPTGSQTEEEWVELYNYGATAINITGWHLKDQDSDLMTIPSAVIGAKSFLVLARGKAAFEAKWLGGVASPQVIQYGTGNFALSDTGGDELQLTNTAGAIVWRVAYGEGDSPARATFYSGDDLSTGNWDHGVKGATTGINRNGVDAPSSRLGYEGCEFTDDPAAFAGGRDYGSPLRGHYSGANSPAPPTTWTFDFTAAGKPVNQGVRGLAVADQSLDRHDNSELTAILPSLQTARGGSIRGVAGGLYADMYDWKSRNGMPRPPTLEYMRWARDYNVTLYVTANTRGLTTPSLTVSNFREYYTSDTATLAQLAADWVRYTNHIVQTYRQGDSVNDSRDAAILSQLTWATGYVNEFGRSDNYTTLLAPGEAAVPPVTFWEIGNEPTVSLANAFSVTNGFTFADDPAEYTRRYIAITEAMLAEDSTIKVGPCVVNGHAGKNAAILSTLLQSSAHIDFISYHPYGSMNDWLTLPLGQQGYLDYVYDEQASFLGEIKALVAQYRPAQSESMQYITSEANVSDFRTNNLPQEASMAHALGSVETVMSFARLGLMASHYWIWISATPTYLDDYNRFIVTMAYEKMRDELGDSLLSSFDGNSRIRGYALRDAETGAVQLWLMNFSNGADQQMTVHMQNAPSAGSCTVTSTTLRAISGPTNLFSLNLARDMNGGTPRRDVDWAAEAPMPGADPATMSVTLPASTLTFIKVTPNSSKVGKWGLY